MLQFAIGTQNNEKVMTAKQVLSQILGEATYHLIGKDVPSGFGETPVDEETKTGAYNRAKVLIESKSYDYAIGVESGLVQRYGDTYEEAWCCIMSQDGVWFGYSSGLKVPTVLIDLMKEHNLEHFEVLRIEEIRKLLPVKDRKDTWANYSSHMIVRKISFEESIRNALVQVFSPSDSLYQVKMPASS